MRTVLARDLKPGDLVDLEPTFRAFAIDDEAEELRARVHWSIYELAAVERVEIDPLESAYALIEHDYGVMSVPVDYALEVEDDTAFRDA